VGTYCTGATPRGTTLYSTPTRNQLFIYLKQLAIIVTLIWLIADLRVFGSFEPPEGTEGDGAEVRRLFRVDGPTWSDRNFTHTHTGSDAGSTPDVERISSSYLESRRAVDREDGLFVTDDRDRLDLFTVHRWLSEES
jgi:hypothetical protein